MEKRHFVSTRERERGGNNVSRVSIEGNIIETRVGRRCTSRPVGHASLGSVAAAHGCCTLREALPGRINQSPPWRLALVTFFLRFLSLPLPCLPSAPFFILCFSHRTDASLSPSLSLFEFLVSPSNEVEPCCGISNSS